MVKFATVIAINSYLYTTNEYYIENMSNQAFYEIAVDKADDFQLEFASRVEKKLAVPLLNSPSTRREVAVSNELVLIETGG